MKTDTIVTLRRRTATAFAHIILVVASTSFAGQAPGSGAVTQPPTGNPITTNANNAPAPTIGTLDSATLKSYGFGAGIAGIVMDKAGVENATVDAGGVIRVDEASKARAGGVFEAHFFLKDIRKSWAEDSRLSKARLQGGLAGQAAVQGKIVSDLAHGPTVLVELGENVVRSFGIGYLFSLRDLQRDVSGDTITYTPVGTAFNFGIVGLMEPNVKVLGEGLKKNTALPAGDAIRFDREPHYGVGLLFSWSF